MTAKLSLEIKVSSEVLTQEVGNETVLLDLKSEQYFSLDNVGSRTWQLIEEHLDLKIVFDKLLAEYNVCSEQLEYDLLKLIDELDKEGLITIGKIKNA